jgi:hypothetical protein
LDVPQEQLRTIVLPPDPLPIPNARPENYVSDTNPLSALGANASPSLSRFSAQIGTLTFGGGVPSAFDSNVNKSFAVSAGLAVSNSSYNNYVGINWGGDVSGITTPSSLMAPIQTHAVSSFAIYAPNDKPFLWSGPTSYVVQGSPVDAGWGSWTTIASGTTAGTIGETISGVTTGGKYQFHRVAFLGNGVSPVAIAQAQLSVSDGQSEP